METRPEKTYEVQRILIDRVPADGVFREEVVYDYWLEVYLTPLFADRHRRFRVSLFSIVNPDGTHCPLGVDVVDAEDVDAIETRDEETTERGDKEAIRPRTVLTWMAGNTQRYESTCFKIQISESQFETLSKDATLHFVVEDLSDATPNRHTELIQMQNGHMSGM